MTRKEQRYFKWLIDQVPDPRGGHMLLLLKLYDTRFIYILPMDKNRMHDGVDLRYMYVAQTGHEMPKADDTHCTVLEMMVGLSIRCEKEQMHNQDFGDRTGIWFWNMIRSMGLIDQTDDCFNEEAVDICLAKMMGRRYEPNGKGGLFTVKEQKVDMRDVEIWYQMMRYLNEIMFLGQRGA